MRGAALVTLAGLLGLTGVAQTDLARVPQALFAPAYDAVTQASMRNLGLAMQSYLLLDGTDVTVQELADWGWVPSDTTAVTIWVDGDRFRAVARDVRPGAATFEVSTFDGAGLTVRQLERRPLPQPPAAGVTILRGRPGA